MTKTTDPDVERHAYELKSLMFSEITELFSRDSNNQPKGKGKNERSVNAWNINERSASISS